MKRIVVALMLALLLAAGCSRGTPKAVTPETSHNFGDVPVITDMKKAGLKEFLIANEGTSDLKLKGVKVKLLEGC